MNPMKRCLLSFPGLAVLLSGLPLTGGAAPSAYSRPKIAILPAKVTLNGLPRPDLGQSLADIINARLLQSPNVELLDTTTFEPEAATVPPAGSPSDLPPAVPSAPTGPTLFPAPGGNAASGFPAASVTPSTSPPGPAAPPVSVVATGKSIGADLIVVPTVIGMGNEFRLTFREIQVSDGKIQAIIHEKTTTGLKGLYALAENNAFRLVPPRPVEPRIHSGPTIIDYPTPPPPAVPPAPPVSEQEIAAAPKALANISPAKLASIEATKRMLAEGASPSAVSAEPSPIGRISALDLTWSFCAISLKTPLVLPAGTALFACAEGNPQNIIHFKVTRMEGSKVIADFGANPKAAALQAGDTVYQWKVPTPP